MTDAPGYFPDLMRLVRLAGLVHPTGIDRVELAYLRHLLCGFDGAVHALVRCERCFIVLERSGMVLLDGKLQNSGPWDALRRSGRLQRRRGPVAAAEATTRALAIDVVFASALGTVLARRFPPGTDYLNVGRTDLDAEVFDAVRAVQGADSVVLIRDTLPFYIAELQRDDTCAMLRR